MALSHHEPRSPSERGLRALCHCLLLSQQASDCSIEALPLSLYGIETSQRNELLLGYTAVNLSETRQGVHCLKAALHNPAIAH